MFGSQVALQSEQSKIQQNNSSKSSSPVEHAHVLVGQVCDTTGFVPPVLYSITRYAISLMWFIHTVCGLQQGNVSIAGDYKSGDVLGGKFTVVETLGRGSSGVTYKVLKAATLQQPIR